MLKKEHIMYMYVLSLGNSRPYYNDHNGICVFTNLPATGESYEKEHTTVQPPMASYGLLL